MSFMAVDWEGDGRNMDGPFERTGPGLIRDIANISSGQEREQIVPLYVSELPSAVEP